MGIETTVLTLSNGSKVVAPSDPNFMTNYVLREQGEWFEDEIEFVRALVNPGMNALDIGANYGLYTNAIASAMKNKKDEMCGHLWCFEPTPDTASALRETLVENSYENVEVIEVGLSDQKGDATFYLSDNAELNSLTKGKTSSREVMVKLETLDDCCNQFSWPKIDFVKLDAEGEEINILKGGQKFFEKNSPIVMYELKHADTTNTELIEAFNALGMKSYVYNASLGGLLPFDHEKAVDGFQLNLFALRHDIAEHLEKKEVLVTKPDSAIEGSLTDPVSGLKFGHYLSTSEKYLRLLKHYSASQDRSNVLSVRYSSLMEAMKIVDGFIDLAQEKKPERLITFARVAQSSGQRQLAAEILSRVIKAFAIEGRPFQVDELFLVPEKSFDSVNSDNPRILVVGSAVDAWLRLSVYSSYFGDKGTQLSYIAFLEKIGLALPSILKRKELLLKL
jgi:FkbM family methyltransferase